MPITFECVCGKQLRAGEKNAGRSFPCPSCGTDVIVPAPDAVDLGIRIQDDPTTVRVAIPPPAPPFAPAARDPSPFAPPAAPFGPPMSAWAGTPQRVVVVDLDMPFGSMVVFIIKWTLASIPAILILWLILGGIFLVATLALSALRVPFR